MNSVMFSSNIFFKNATIEEDSSNHKLVCEFDVDKTISIHDINLKLSERGNIDLCGIQYIVDGYEEKRFYGYTKIESIQQVDSITDGYDRCKLTLCYPTIDEFIPFVCKVISELKDSNELTAASVNSVYAQSTSDIRLLLMNSFNK